jgi:copper chaperone CopZ
MQESMILKVNGLFSAEHENVINSKLSELEGIKSALASDENKEVRVDFDTDKISMGDIIQNIQDAGFEVVQE